MKKLSPQYKKVKINQNIYNNVCTHSVHTSSVQISVLFPNEIIYSDLVFMKRPDFFFNYELDAWLK